MKLGVWLLSMVEPLLARVLVLLGLSVVTVTGVDAALGVLKTAVVSNWSAMPALWLDWALYLWMGKALGVIFGAITTRLAIMSIQGASKFLGRAQG